jgi:hypothetical protein
MAWVLVMVVGLGCTRKPRLIEYDEDSNNRARSAPLVIVGVVDSETPIGHPVPSRRDPDYPMQLRRARVEIENVLKGSLPYGTAYFYYFGFAGGSNGPRPLGFLRSTREVLWLRRDSGVLRMACDGWDYCTIFVAGGAHLGYEPDPKTPLDYALADILLTRGEGSGTDLQFASQITRGVPGQGLQEYVIGKLRQLALTEPPIVKAAACEQLWIYTQDRISSGFRQQANDSLQAVHCVCRVKPDGNVACQ